MATEDIAAVLEALRAEVKARRQANPGAERTALELQLERAIEQIEITRVVSAHWPLEGSNLIQRAWVLVHKVVRRYLRWYINPIVDQQNAFNDSAARVLRLLAEGYADLRMQLDALQEARKDDDDSDPPAPPASHDSAAASAASEPNPQVAKLQAELQQRQQVSAHWDLGGPTLLAKLNGLQRRVVRQYLRWLINPIVEQQNAFNVALSESVAPVLAIERELARKLAALKRT
jgi:hypothetical protein